MFDRKLASVRRPAERFLHVALCLKILGEACPELLSKDAFGLSDLDFSVKHYVFLTGMLVFQLRTIELQIFVTQASPLAKSTE